MPAVAAPQRAWVEQIMGMPISIRLRGDLSQADGAVAEAFASLHEVDRVFSTYRPDSQVSRIRSGELDPAAAEQQVRDVAALCQLATTQTQGWFDAWLPEAHDPDGPRLFEPSGLVKGWAAQRVGVALAAALPSTDVLVNAGGDITAHCNRRDTDDWHLAVENPLVPGALVSSITMRDGGLATSGTAARGTHILSPLTGRAVAELASVSIAGPALMWVDVYATAAFAMGPGCRDWLPTLNVFSWSTVDLDGTLTHGPGALAG